MGASIGFADGVKLFFQFGPFFLVPFLLLVVQPKLRAKMKDASRDLKKILKFEYALNLAAVFALIILCVGFWWSERLGPRFYYGEILNVDPSEYEIKSPKLYLASRKVADEDRIDWIWKKAKDDIDAPINFVKGTSSTPAKRFYLYCSELGRKSCRLIYDDAGGLLKYRGRALPTAPKEQARRPDSGGGFGGFSLWAAPGSASQDADVLLKSLQAMDFTIRNEALESAWRRGEKDERFLVLLLQKGFAILTAGPSPALRPESADFLLSGLLPILYRISRSGSKSYDEWRTLLGEKSIDLLIESAGRADPGLSVTAAGIFKNLGDPAYGAVVAKADLPEYRGNAAFLQGAIAILSQHSRQITHLEELQDKDWLREDPKLSRRIDANLEQLRFQVPADSPEAIKKAVAEALAIKDKGTPYRWGGQGPEEGLDSAGFIAWALKNGGFVDRPEEWGWERLLKEMGRPRPENRPQRPGDLIFYKGGIVMLFLGGDLIVGMTENGIFLGKFADFRGAPYQVNVLDPG